MRGAAVPAIFSVFVLVACAGRANAPDAQAVRDTVPEPDPIEAGEAPPPGPYAPGFDAVHYDVRLSLPDTGTVIRGRTTVRVALVEPRRDTLPLDLTGLAVTDVRVDGGATASRHEAGKLYIPVPAEARVDDTVAVEVEYRGRPDDGLILQNTVHGEPAAFADNWPNRARFWFPSIDHPSDKATVAFAVEAPGDRRVIANGTRTDSGAVTRWATDVPIPTYTMVIGATRFTVGRIGTAACGRAPRSPRADGCIEVTSWAFPPDSASAARIFDRGDEMVSFYSDLVAPFPYEKLAHVQSATRFGGMENASAIFYSEQAIAEGYDIEHTVAHETAHQWFGDAVTEADWHHLWLSEGFATYFGALFFEHADGVERFRKIMERNKISYFKGDVHDDPVVDPEVGDLFALLNANNYQKGAWVLHMLRGLLGDDVFFEGIRRYYERHEHGTALTADLRRALEAVADRDLGNFFDQWVFSPGYPRLRVDSSWDEEAGRVEVVVEQVQPSAWPTFRMPLEIEFRTARGAVRRTVELDGRRTTARFDLADEPAGLRVDPDGWLLIDTIH